MKIIDQSTELLKQGYDPYDFIEKIARTCYKSESRGNPIAFVNGLKNSHHWAMLEHAYVYFKLDDIARINFLQQMTADELKFINVQHNFVSGSFRAFLELSEPYTDSEYTPSNMSILVLVEMLRRLSTKYPDIFNFNLEEYKLKPSYGAVELMNREDFIADIKENKYVFEESIISSLIPHTVKFITNRGVSHELVRHRLCSFAQESQRYIGYDKNKFGNEITVIRPLLDENTKDFEEWQYAMEWCETVYMNLRGRDIQAQIARGVLPNDCKTEIVVTATEKEWQHIVNLRYHGTTGAPHPQIHELIGMAYPMLSEESEGRIK